MIEIAFTLVDYLIKFLQKREDNAEEYFERYVSPAYDSAETVFSDYLVLLTEIEKKIAQNVAPTELIKFLEEGRVKYLPLRMRIRAEITSRFDRFNTVSELPDFERGILGILMGGMAPFEDSRNNDTPYYKSHTLLDVLHRFKSYAASGNDQWLYLETIYEQIKAIKRAWEDVVKGYAEYKKLAVPSPSEFKKMSHKREDN